jgi:hypothetical protein
MVKLQFLQNWGAAGMLAMNVGNIHSASLETHDVVSLL